MSGQAWGRTSQGSRGAVGNNKEVGGKWEGSGSGSGREVGGKWHEWEGNSKEKARKWQGSGRGSGKGSGNVDILEMKFGQMQL